MVDNLPLQLHGEGLALGVLNPFGSHQVFGAPVSHDLHDSCGSSPEVPNHLVQISPILHTNKRADWGYKNLAAPKSILATEGRSSHSCVAQSETILLIRLNCDLTGLLESAGTYLACLSGSTAQRSALCDMQTCRPGAAISLPHRAQP